MKRIVIETYSVKDIPIMTLAGENANNCPLAFFVHGFMHDKKAGLPLGYRLAELGFYVISLDAFMHGERFDESLKDVWEPKPNYVYPPDSGLDVFYLLHKIVVHTANDIGALIAHFAKDARVDTERIGITGFSMGGFTTFYATANLPQIKAAVPICGVPTFAARWADVTLEASSYLQWADTMTQAEAETAKISAFMRSIDPARKLEAFYPKPLMMISGDRDIDAPKKYSVNMYRALKPLYAEQPERLRLSIHDDAGHELTLAMMQEVCDWFCKYLRDVVEK